MHDLSLNCIKVFRKREQEQQRKKLIRKQQEQLNQTQEQVSQNTEIGNSFKTFRVIFNWIATIDFAISSINMLRVTIVKMFLNEFVAKHRILKDKAKELKEKQYLAQWKVEIT